MKGVSVRGRFHRSVQLIRDSTDSRQVRDYILTTTGREIANAVIDGLQQQHGSRAWSITGPFGTGKSAFATFLVDLLSHRIPHHPDGGSIRINSAFVKPRLLPVLIVGRRGPFSVLFGDALERAFDPLDKAVARRLHRLVSRSQSGTASSDVFNEVVGAAIRLGWDGLLIVVDEFGKLLEYSAQNPDTEDLLVYQELAEWAARCDAPVAVLTILHSSFADYLETSDDARRREWQKVQGRFTDVAFLEPPEQLLKLVASAIQIRSAKVAHSYQTLIAKILRNPCFSEAIKRGGDADVLASCAPLHPVVALLVAPIFRGKLSQNERSLFSFLTGFDPFGFAAFLGEAAWTEKSPPLYSPDLLYDYIAVSLGSAVFFGDRGHQWAEIDQSLQRLPADSDPISRQIVMLCPTRSESVGAGY